MKCGGIFIVGKIITDEVQPVIFQSFRERISAAFR